MFVIVIFGKMIPCFFPPPVSRVCGHDDLKAIATATGGEDEEEQRGVKGEDKRGEEQLEDIETGGNR